MSELRWLHLSDVHLRPSSSDSYEADTVLNALIETLEAEAAKGQQPDVIFFTGDIADKGKDYSRAEKFFDSLLDATGLSKKYGKNARRYLFIVPGNHDVDRDEMGIFRSPDSLDKVNTFFAPDDDFSRMTYFKRFKAYEEFFNRYFEGIRSFNKRNYYYAEVLELPDISIHLGIIGLNSAWFSEDTHDCKEKRLWIGERTCTQAFKSLTTRGEANLIIALHHHPYSCLHPEEMKLVKGLLTEKAHVCLYGHLHESETEQVKDAHGKVLRFQSGATYDDSSYPYRILWGTVNLEANKVNIRPMKYEASSRRWALDTSLFSTSDYTEDFDLPCLIQPTTSVLPACDPVSFYSGGLATPSDIAANLDVPRTQYIHEWTDENANHHKAWKDLLLTQAKNTLSEKKFRVVIVYGHRGSGKTTLCKRMIHDLMASSIPVFDILGDTLAPEHVDAIITKIKADPKKCLHIFTEIEDISEEIDARQFRAAIKQIADLNVAITIYAAIDTNKWKQIEAKVGRTVHATGCVLGNRHLEGRLDGREMAELISRLKNHHCLFRLEHKTDETIKLLMLKKAKRRLLPSLIELTRGTEAEQELSDILWLEYQDLSNKAQWAYALVIMFHAFGIAIPYSVMEGALRELTGDQGYFESEDFQAETAEIVYRPMSASYSSRHRLVAETLLQRFLGVERDSFKYKLLKATLNSLNLSNEKHHHFFKKVLNRKVFGVMTNLEPLIEEVEEGEFTPIQDRDISRVLNSIIRIYQGRGKNEEGKQLAGESLKRWNHIGNQASYLRAFCCFHLGETDEVRKAVFELVKRIDYPYHVLHGITLLRVLRDWKAADMALHDFEESMGSEIPIYLEYYRLRREVDQGLRVQWSDSDIGTLSPGRALERIEYILAGSGSDEKTVINQYKTLVRRQHDFFKAYLSFFKYLNQQCAEDDEDTLLERYRELQHECEYHIDRHEDHYRKYPPELLSILHSNLARALFKIDYIQKNGYQNRKDCEGHFQKAISMKAKNGYALNWYGTFLKEVVKDREGAREYYKRAMNGDETNPMFKQNLALLYYEAPTYSRNELKKALKLASDSRSLCTEDSQWEDFYYYPNELIAGIYSLMARTDIKDGDPLDHDMSFSPDAD
jgi:predicted phosphodiesterase/energy-coupling factor transporter ATP-binding protein EcfA2